LNFAMLRQSCNTSVRLSSCQSSPSTLVNSIAIGQNRPSGVVRPRAPTKILTVSASSSEEDSSAGFFGCTEDFGGSACACSFCCGCANSVLEILNVQGPSSLNQLESALCSTSGSSSGIEVATNLSTGKLQVATMCDSSRITRISTCISSSSK